MFSRAARVPQRLPSCRTGLHRQLRVRLASTSSESVTSASTSSTPTTSTPTTNSAHKPGLAKPILPKVRGAATRTAYIRAWRPVADLAELYSMIRAIEQKFGKVLEAHFLKDFEDSTKYQLMCFIVFADAKSVQQIPDGGIDMAVPTQPTGRQMSEIGLQEIESVMFANETDEGSSAEGQTPVNSMGFNLMRSNFDYMSDGHNHKRIFQSTHIRTMEQFENWGGFAKLGETSNPSHIVKEWELFANADGADQTRMRAALQICERNFRRDWTPKKPHNSNVEDQHLEKADSESPDQPLSNATSESVPVTPVKVPALASKFAQEAAKPKSESTPTPTPEPIPEATPEPVAKPELEKILLETPSTAIKTPSSPPSIPPRVTQKAAPTKAVPAKKGTSTAPKLVIPPPVVQKSNAPTRRKEPKPKIKPVKAAPKKPQPTTTPESHSSKEDGRAPEPEAPQGALGKLWSFFGRKST